MRDYEREKALVKWLELTHPEALALALEPFKREIESFKDSLIEAKESMQRSIDELNELIK